MRVFRAASAGSILWDLIGIEASVEGCNGFYVVVND